MPGFKRIDLFDRLACQGGQTKLGTLYDRDLVSAVDVEAIDDTESLAFAFSRVDAFGSVRQIVPSLVGRTIATVVWDDDSFDERRVSLINDGSAVGGLIDVTANPLAQDLADGADSATGKGYVSVVLGCLRVFDIAVVGLTATQIWDTYVIPACPSWVSRGTIDSNVVIPQLSWSRLTPHALALLVRDTLRRMNVNCELRLRRNGTTDYKLDLVSLVGANAAVPVFHPRSSLHSMRRRKDTTNQATRLFVTGETDPTGLAGIPGRARWKVTNVDGVNKKLTLTDPSGGAGPIGSTDQWKNTYIARPLTGRTFAIQASDAVNQTVTLLDVSTFAVDEMVEIRMTEPGTNTRVIANPSPRYAVSSVAGNNLTLSGNPLTVNGQLVDWYARVWTASVGGAVVGTPQRISSTTSTDVITVASGAGFNNTHHVEFVQLDGAGEIPCYLEHPPAIASYGVKVADLAVTSVIGATQLGKNAWMRNWSNALNPPDGWSWSVTPSIWSQNTNPSFTRYGGASVFADFLTGGALQTPRFDHLIAPGNNRISLRAQILFATFSAAGSLNATFGFQLTLHPLDAAGAPQGAIATTAVKPVDTTDTGFANKLAAGAWATIEIVGVDLSNFRSVYGLVARLAVFGDQVSAQCTAYVDA
ncbi:MAG TPA: hypothetical protein VIP11_11995, partial [Gemmatimonadaceae bacterium]